MVAVCESAFLERIDGPPLGTGINTASNADFLAGLLSVGDSFDFAVSQNGQDAIRSTSRRRSPQACLGRYPRHLRCHSHEIGLPHRARQREVRLLEVLHVELQRTETSFVHNVMHPMDNSLGRNVILAPDGSRHRATLSVGGHYVELVTPGTLNWRDVKAEQMTLLACTFDMVYVQLACF